MHIRSHLVFNKAAKSVCCTTSPAIGWLRCLALLVMLSSSTAMAAGAVSNGPGGGPTGVIGADMVVSRIGENSGGLIKNGTVGDITAYSWAVTECNAGDEWAVYLANVNQHPLIHENLYRIKGGRFEHVGMSWVLHTWCAADFFECIEDSEPNAMCDFMTIGIANVISSSLMGKQEDMGPRSDVNAANGLYAYPYTIAWNQSGNAIFKRVQVHNSDLADSTGDDGLAVYLAEAQVQTTDEPLSDADTPHNNASWRQVVRGDLQGGGYVLDWEGDTHVAQTALEAWPLFDSAVTVEEEYIAESEGTDGRVLVASRAEDLGNGQWSYDYTVMNMNSDRSIRSFTVPIPNGESVGSVEFRDIDHHSGEPFDGTDWNAVIDANGITWSTQSYGENQLANAIRYGTAYSFHFESSAPAVFQTKIVELGAFKPGPGDDIVTVSATVPALDCDDSGVADETEIDEGELVDVDSNAIPDVCQLLVATGDNIGARGLSANLISGDPAPFAIRITGNPGDPNVSCVDAYAQGDGTIGPVPVEQTAAAWGAELTLTGEVVIPESAYQLTFEGLNLPPVSITTARWGDANGDGLANLADVFLTVLGYQGEFEVPLQAIDVTPCEPDGNVTLADAFLFVLAFQGADYSSAGCPAVCD